MMDPVGFAGPTADALDDILETTSLAQWHVDSFHDSCYDSLDCFGDSYHTASPNEEQGLGWHVRWVSDVLSFIALF